MTEPIHRTFIVQVISHELEGNLTTSIFGPLTETEADGFCTSFNNLYDAENKLKTAKDYTLARNYTLSIIELDNPWTLGIPPDLRHKLFGGLEG